MITFNRLKLLCDDPEKIADAVAAVPSDIVQLSEDKTKIRRNISNSLPENSLEYWQKIKNRTVYMVCLNCHNKTQYNLKFRKDFLLIRIWTKL